MLAAYAKEQSAKLWADLFITDRMSVSRDAAGQPVAHIAGDAKTISAESTDTRIPCVAMLFGLAKGVQPVQFEIHNPNDQSVASETRYVHVAEDQRVSFASTAIHFSPKTNGKYSVVVKKDDKEIGRTFVHLDLADDDDDLVEEDDTDAVDDGMPDVDVIVAEHGNDDPLILHGIRSAWEERSYPRRVDFSWLTRGTRGWSGTNVIVTAFTLDDTGAIVGRSDGCIFWEIHAGEAVVVRRYDWRRGPPARHSQGALRHRLHGQRQAGGMVADGSGHARGRLAGKRHGPLAARGRAGAHARASHDHHPEGDRREAGHPEVGGHRQAGEEAGEEAGQVTRFGGARKRAAFTRKFPPLARWDMTSAFPSPLLAR